MQGLKFNSEHELLATLKLPTLHIAPQRLDLSNGTTINPNKKSLTLDFDDAQRSFKNRLKTYSTIIIILKTAESQSWFKYFYNKIFVLFANKIILNQLKNLMKLLIH